MRKKPDLELDSINDLDLAKILGLIIFLDLTNFTQKFALNFILSTSLLLSILSIILSSLLDLRSLIECFIPMVLCNKISRVTI